MTAPIRARCAQCGAEIRLRRGAEGRGEAADLFCCYGCALVHQIAGARKEQGEPPWILARLGLAAFLTMNVMAMSLVLYADDPIARGGAAVDPLHAGMTGALRYVSLLFSAPVFVLLGWPILESGWRDLRTRGGSVDVLISLGALGAFVLSAGSTLRGAGAVYYETACMILVLVTLGRYLEAKARSRAAASLEGLLAGEPETAAVLRGGAAVAVAPGEVLSGEIVRVAAGGLVPVDGIVIDGEGGVDESSLTGEAVPVRKTPGDTLYAGTLSVDGAFDVRATATGADRLAARITKLLDAGRASRAPVERLADRAAAAFVPLAAVLAAAAGIYGAAAFDPGAGLMRSLAVLLIACPCALGLATPLAVWEAMGRAARRGVVMRSGEALERLASIRTVFLDKTGTLTEGTPRVASVVPMPGAKEAEVLALASALEMISPHPFARAIVEEARRRGLHAATLRRFKVHAGAGVEGEVALAGDEFAAAAVGGRRLMMRMGFAGPELSGGTEPAAWVAAGGRVIGRIQFEERLRPEAAAAVEELRREGLQIKLLSGDSEAAARRLALSLDVGGRGALSPAAKVEEIARGEIEAGPAAMVGEGINDAPALARASLSIALGCGAEVARDASDISLLTNDLRLIPWLVRLSRKTMRTIRINLFWAFFYNTLLIPLAMSGRLQPIFAALAMIASSLFVAGSSLALGRDGAREQSGAPSGEPARGGVMEAWAR